MPYLGEFLSVGAAVFWAVGVILFKRSGETMPPMALNLFKNSLALVLMLATMPLLGEAYLPEDQPASSWALLALSGFLGIAVADTLFFVSLGKLGAGLAAVVDTSYTPVMLGLSFVFLGERIGLLATAGAALIMFGLLIGSAAKPERGKSRRDVLEGTIIGVVGIALMAVSIVMVKNVLNGAPMVWATTVRLAAGALGVIPLILLSPRRGALMESLRPSATWKFAAPAALVGTYLAMIAWIGGMKYTQHVSIAALLNQMSTIFIFVLAVVFLREPLTARRSFAIGCGFVGAALVVW